MTGDGNCLAKLFLLIRLSFGYYAVGLPNVGKSTLTNLLAGANHAEAANYRKCCVVVYRLIRGVLCVLSCLADL